MVLICFFYFCLVPIVFLTVVEFKTVLDIQPMAELCVKTNFVNVQDVNEGGKIRNKCSNG